MTSTQERSTREDAEINSSITSMGDARVATDIGPQRHQGVELLPLTIVQAEHVV